MKKRKRFKQNITVDDVRSLKSFFGFSAADGGARVVIIDAADDMTGSAANALLKNAGRATQKCLFVFDKPSTGCPFTNPAFALPRAAPLCLISRYGAASSDPGKNLPF